MNELRGYIKNVLDYMNSESNSGRMRIAHLRTNLPTISRKDLDKELKQMQREEILVLWNNDDPLDETDEDKKAAIDICGEKRTLLYLL